MVALYRQGRQAEALEAYRDARRTLVDELGIEPSPTLQELERDILRHDRALEVESAAAPVRSILVVGEDKASLESLLGLAVPLARRPPRELILVQIVAVDAFPGANELLAQRRDELQARGLASRAAAFSSTQPGRDLVRLAAEQDVDLALLAGALDSRAETIFAHAPCDVALLLDSDRAPTFDAERPILVPFGGADHDWAAVELATWLAQAGGAPLRLVGVATADGDDASRLLASVSLIVQRVAGVSTAAALIEPGEEGLVRAAENAGLIVFGLSATWREKGPGEVRAAVALRAAAPTLLVRKGLRPSGLAPEASLTRFTWSLRR